MSSPLIDDETCELCERYDPNLPPVGICWPCQAPSEYCACCRDFIPDCICPAECGDECHLYVTGDLTYDEDDEEEVY